MTNPTLPPARGLAVLLALLSLAACGGGGGGTDPDPVAPTITVSGVEDGGVYDPPVTVSVSVDRGTYTVTLDGAQVASGFTVSAPGDHLLRVDARNGAATSSRTVAFTLRAPGGDPLSASVAPEIATLAVGRTERFGAVGREADDTPVTAGFAWRSTDTGVATVDASGHVTAVAPGNARIVAETASGAADTARVTVVSLSTPAEYRPHLELGVPRDDDPTDEIVLAKPGYALSYNEALGSANWIAWNFNRTHTGSQDRCDCFGPDPQLPDTIYRVVSSDYTGSGYTRGHMVMSGQRTRTAAENAETFLMTNILPQRFDLNGGPWLDFEIHTIDLAEDSGKEIYQIAGGIYPASPATLNGQGRVAIPDSTWKIVVALDFGETLADVSSAADLEVIAVNMPNVNGIQSQSWTAYRTSVDAIEQATGYDFLAELPDDVEAAVEAASS